MKELPKSLKLARLLYMMSADGIDIYNFAWALSTRRLSGKTETMLMSFIGARTLQDVVLAIESAFETASFMARYDFQELLDHRWLTASSIEFAKRFAQRPDVRRWAVLNGG